MSQLSPYAGRTVALATRHGKERVIGRALRHGLGAELLHLHEVDTDQLGSFCGAIPRQGSALQACTAKAQLALERGGTGLAIASEGSFGPHPAVPLLAVGLECLVFLDSSRGLSLSEELLAPRTNYSQRLLQPPASDRALIAELQPWLQQVHFPSHALIVRPQGGPSEVSGASTAGTGAGVTTDAGGVTGTGPSGTGVVGPGDATGAVPTGAVVKGIHDLQALITAIRQLAPGSTQGCVRLETDMRAHCNPTRMASIRRLSFRLVRRLATPCPRCGSPGWGRIGLEAGLPCGWCGLPTELTRAERWGCARCEHRQERPRADGLRYADPGQCLACNP